MKNKLMLAVAIFAACMLCTVVLQDRKIKRLTDERDKYRENTETLLEQSVTYQVRDSLNAAKVGTLKLTIQELEKFRANDAALVKDLKARNRDLDALTKAQMQTIERLRCVPRDTVFMIDTVMVSGKVLHCGDSWYTFDGLLTEDEFTGTMRSRDRLLITETVRYKKILWWKTNKIIDREVEAMSENPHTTIEGLEHIIIER